MAIQKRTIEVSGEFTVKYDPDSPEFKESFESYTSAIDKGATVDDMIKHVCFHVNRFGINSMVEGVGYVQREGREIPPDAFSGIVIEEDEPDFYFDII